MRRMALRSSSPTAVKRRWRTPRTARSKPSACTELSFEGRPKVAKLSAMTCSPYAGALPAREKIVNAYAADHTRAAERHLRFASARLGLRLSAGARIPDFRSEARPV